MQKSSYIVEVAVRRKRPVSSVIIGGDVWRYERGISSVVIINFTFYSRRRNDIHQKKNKICIRIEIVTRIVL